MSGRCPASQAATFRAFVDCGDERKPCKYSRCVTAGRDVRPRGFATGAPRALWRERTKRMLEPSPDAAPHFPGPVQHGTLMYQGLLSAHCGRSRVSASGWLQRGAADGVRFGSSARERQAGLACSAPCPPAPAFGRRLLLYLRRTRQPVLTLCHLRGIACAGTCVGTLRWHRAEGGGQPAAAGKGGDASRQDGVGGHGGSRLPAALGHAPALARSSTQYEGQQWAASGLRGHLDAGLPHLMPWRAGRRAACRARHRNRRCSCTARGRPAVPRPRRV